MPFRFFRLGPIEIVIILAIILVLFGASRATKLGQNLAKRAQQAEDEAAKKQKTASNPRLQIFGILTVLIGIIFLAFSFGIFKWVTSVGIWGIVVIAVGVTMVFIARRS